MLSNWMVMESRVMMRIRAAVDRTVFCWFQRLGHIGGLVKPACFCNQRFDR